jgi:predicted nucleic-acid-binding protein
MLIKQNACFVPITVALELEWVLRNPYRLDVATVATAFDALTQVRNLHFEREPALQRAVELYRSGFDFADALHYAGSDGCDELATFDKGFASLADKAGLAPPVRRLS